MSDIIPILFTYLNLESKFKVAQTNSEYLKLFQSYKKNNLYTNSNIELLQKIIKEWKHIKHTKIINIWSPKHKPFNREILLS
tara:strand:- start:503 stop:748 length:246 start_codon:yes stop_codon:yes gene_type:complete